ncbi:DNA-directed RNA polymerase subunit B'' [Candidatus Micrarchaeota archaeon]|nr:DNA-directed RNA polymerase subunit B'' [Candidatus Micrarchaeota archaeon]
MKNELEAYFREHSFVRQHLESYNRFIDNGMQSIIDNVGVIPTNIEGYSIRLGKVRLEKPMIIEADGSRREILPNEARLRGITYSAPIFLEVISVMHGIESMVSEVYIGELPVMLKSKLCYLENMSSEELIDAGEDPDDPGGYFIINGSEKVLVGIEDLAPNRLITTKEGTKSIVISKIFSTKDGFRARCVVERKNNGIFKLEFPSSPTELYLTIVLKALGLKNNKAILENLPDDLMLKNDFLINFDEDKTKTNDDALKYLGKRVMPNRDEAEQLLRAELLLDTYLLPHISKQKEDRIKKAKFLIEMAYRANLVGTERVAPDDKDHYANKRVKISGVLMEDLFRYAFKFLVRDIQYQASRAEARGRRLIVQNLVRPDALSDRIRIALATGNWVAGQTGVAQLLDRTSYLSMLSHLRRVISPLSKKHPHFLARDLHGTHWGKICPTESPEGPNIALVKNLALITEVTPGEQNEQEHVNAIIEKLKENNVKMI